MGRNIYILVILLVVSLTSQARAARLQVERGSDLQAVINHAADGDTLVLGVKEFESNPTEFTDSLCGNCEDPNTTVKATFGFIVRDKALTILGSDRSGTRLVTNAGYGLYFVNSRGSIIRNLTITGGKRDGDGMATDGGVVVRNSSVRIEEVDIRDNDDRIDTVVVGIGGIIGREGSELTVSHCNIVNNGWDGMALYRGAWAQISDCLIKDGRGAGIGVTWDAACMAYRNEVTGYWKGIGSFGRSILIARNNIVHNNLGWGIIATGQSCLDASNNVVHHNGNCGIAPWSTESRGRIVNNIISENGWREQWVCPCVGVQNYGDWAKWEFRYNIVFNNVVSDYQDIWDQTGIDGNLCVDPSFVGDGDYHITEDSPAFHEGDPKVYNPDGTRSHIGIDGGPQGRR